MVPEIPLWLGNAHERYGVAGAERQLVVLDSIVVEECYCILDILKGFVKRGEQVKAVALRYEDLGLRVQGLGFRVKAVALRHDK